MTIFLGCGFAAKYREGGGNFSVPLQWMLGLRRLKLDAIWLEILPATENRPADEACIVSFQRRLREHGLGGRYCLLYQKPASAVHELGNMRCHGLTKRELLARLAGPNTLLNLSHSLHAAIPVAVRAQNILRSRSERNFLLDDKTGIGPIASSRILDDRIERPWSRLPIAKIEIEMENIFSAG